MSVNVKKEYLDALMSKKRLSGLENIYFFNKYVIEDDPERRKFVVPHVHKEWSDWFHGSDKRIKMILVPRGCFKSTFFTVRRTLQILADEKQRKDARVLIANATLSVAQNFLTEVKDQIRGNEHYKSFYGDLFDKNNKWTDTEINVIGKNLSNRYPSVSAVGVGANLVGAHYSHIICDDLVNQENSSTRYQADKVIDWWKRSLSLLDPQGEMLIIGTRWSYFELYSYLIKHHADDIDFFIRGAYRSDGELYFPELLNEKKLAELKKSQGSYIFSSFYLNDPVDQDSALIKKSQIRYWTEDSSRNGELEYRQLPQKGLLNIFAVCDPAISQEGTADSSSILVVGIDAENNWYVLERRRDKMTVGQLISELISVFRQWKPITMSIEVIGQAQTLLNAINQEENKAGISMPLYPIKARINVRKEMRIRAALQPRFERGQIFIKEDMEDLEEELIKFPKSAHDDMIDALADVDEIGFPPEEQEGDPLFGESEMESRLRVRISDGEDFVDPVLGEYY